MSEMVERVASAIWDATRDSLDFESLSAWASEAAARAAIKAMREPTRVMLEAEQACPRFDSPGSTNPDDVWRAMIDAILKC